MGGPPSYDYDRQEYLYQRQFEKKRKPTSGGRIAAYLIGFIVLLFLIGMVLLVVFRDDGDENFCYIPEDPDFMPSGCRDHTNAYTCVETVNEGWNAHADKCEYGINCEMPTGRNYRCRCTSDDQCIGVCGAEGVCVR